MMASKDLMGREPITRCTLKLDQCTRAWGDGICVAGLYNLLIDSATPSNTAAWNVYGWLITTSQSDPDGGNKAFLLEKDGFTGSGFESQSEAAIYTTDYLYYTIYAKAVLNITDIRVSVGLPSASNADFNFDFSTQAETNGVVWEEFDYTNVTDMGSGWYKIELGVLASRTPVADIYFNLLNGGAEAPDGAQAYVYGLQVTPILNQLYIETTGTPILATSEEPCFNTRATCQDPANYNRGTLPLKFISNRSPSLDDDYYLPCLESVSIGAAQLNPGGANKSSSPLGNRATVSIGLRDFPHNDKLVDPYVSQRVYDPYLRGTFFTKLMARNPYYMHRLIEVESGYLSNGTIIDAITRTFVITSFDGVDSNGNVKISGKDLLTLAEDTKSQAPRASSGKLAAAISTGLTPFDLTPAGIGDLEYPASGFIRIEKEVMSFTRSADTITPVVRGERSTVEEAHDISSTVQLCLEYVSQKPVDILYDLLLNYANIDNSYLDKANWDIEGDVYLPRLYSTLITEPTGVSTLVGEICEQMFFSVWWDERVNLVKVRAVRAPQDDTIYDLTDNENFIRDSVGWKDLPDQLVTEVNVYYGQINPTEKINEAKNYSTVETILNAGSSSANKYGINKIKSIFSRWIPSGAAATANDLATKISNRFGEIPKQVSFKVDAKDSFLWLGDFVRLQNRLLVDQFGLPRLANMQIFSANESEAGSQFRYVANEFFLAEPEDPNALEVIIATNLLNVNLRTLFDAQYDITLAGTETINFRVRSGVVIGGDTAGGGVNVDVNLRDDSSDFYDAGRSYQYPSTIGNVPILQRNDVGSITTTARETEYRLYPSEGVGAYTRWVVKEYPTSVGLDTGTFPAGVVLNLIVEPGAYIIGEGGNGSAHTLRNQFDYPIRGGDGGDALNIQNDINIYNEGIISAGGGGGASVLLADSSISLLHITGGGGAGVISNVTGVVKINTGNPSTNAASGGVVAGGIGGTGSWTVIGLPVTVSANTKGSPPSGNGGDLNTVGEKISRNYASQGWEEYGLGGQPGNAIKSGKNLVTWLLKGDVRGTENI